MNYKSKYPYIDVVKRVNGEGNDILVVYGADGNVITTLDPHFNGHVGALERYNRQEGQKIKDNRR